MENKEYSRFALYYVPPCGALKTFGAKWLGWDIVIGTPAVHFEIPELSQITKKPRRYGFHATLKPPFRLAPQRHLGELEEALRRLTSALAPVSCDGLQLAMQGRILALVPLKPDAGLSDLAAQCVAQLDEFRSPLGAEEFERRNHASLTLRQAALLRQWGYPYVMEEFRFHMTLSGVLRGDHAEHWKRAVYTVSPALSEPLVVDQIALCGEREDGFFEVIKRYTLAG